MAAIDAITLDGHGSDTRYACAIGLHLTALSPLSAVEHLDGWTLELRQGSAFVVARSPQSAGRAEALRTGFEQAERFLDILSFELTATRAIDAPGRSHILLYRNESGSGSGSVLERLQTSDIPMSIKMELTVTRADGTSVPPPPPEPAAWAPALRFYRLSQVSRNPYEAYRNLWLGLETMLSVHIPLGPKEKEGIWLRRAFTQLVGEVDLSHDLPENANFVEHLMERHYAQMRCNLFHAKVGAAHTTAQVPTPEQALDAYAELVRVWRTIARHVSQFRFAGSGVITYVGFAAHMAAVFQDVSFTATDDATPARVTDTVLAAAGDEVAFDSSTHLGVDVPGRVENKGVIDLAGKSELPLFRKIGTSVGGQLYSVDCFGGGLDVNGVDRFEYRQMLRLQNAGSPREHFD